MKKSKIGIIGILFILLAVVAVSGCLGGDTGDGGDGFSVDKTATDSGDVYAYTFDSGNKLTLVVLNQDSMDAISQVGTAQTEYGSEVYSYSSSLWFEPSSGKTASIMDYSACTIDEIKKAIADIKTKV